MLHFLGEADFPGASAGNKAARLDELKRAGFLVPDGFVVPSGLALNAESAAEIERSVLRFGGFPVACRSSAAQEDSLRQSFAGVFATVLQVQDKDALALGIATCRASARRAESAYGRQQGAAFADPAVLIQKMIEPRIAGIAFGVDPVTGRDDRAVIECCRGLGERLASGRVAPARFVCDLETGATLTHTPGDDDIAPFAEMPELLDALTRIQALLRHPQDVEWAVDGHGRLHILQTRPVTRLSWRRDFGELSNANFKDGGVSARVCTPMMHSLYRQSFQPSMEAYVRRVRLKPRRAPDDAWIRMCYGRLYWNVGAVKKALLRIPGFDERTLDSDLGIERDYGPAGPLRGPVSVRTVLGALPIAVSLYREFARKPRQVAQFLGAFTLERDFWKAKAETVGAEADQTFFRDLGTVAGILHRRVESAYFDLFFTNANLQSEFKRFLPKVAKRAGVTPDLLTLLSGTGDIAHVAMQRDFRNLVVLARQNGKVPNDALAAFIARNYFHADASLDLTEPRWGEEPARVGVAAERLRRAGAPPADPEKAAGEQKLRAGAAARVIVQALGQGLLGRLGMRRLFARRLAAARLFLSLREQMRVASMQSYYILRLYLTECGKRFVQAGILGEGADIFMLEVEELTRISLKLAAGKVLPSSDIEQILAKVRVRRCAYETYRDFPAPNEIGGAEESPTTVPTDGRLSGVGCSAGIVEGRACVMSSLQDAHRLEPGDILVTAFTDPGWAHVLGAARGVVAEVGGILSHGAVLAREFGIPAVLNVAKATERIKNGERIRIDGATGALMILGGHE